MDSRSSRRAALALLLCAAAFPARGDFWSEAKKKAAQAAKEAAKGKPAEPAPKAAPAASPAAQPAAPGRPAGKAPPEPLVLPEESKAVIDVLGIQVGRSTPAQVRSVLAERAAGWAVTEKKGEPMHLGPTERDAAALQGLDWVYALAAGTPANVRPRDGLQVSFAAPPSPNRALAVNRVASFTPETGSAPSQVEASLVQKYGPPKPTGLRAGLPVGPNARRLVWAWGFDGQPLALRDDHPALSFPNGSRVETLRAGAASILLVELTIQNDIVVTMQTTAVDLHGQHTAQERTKAYVAAEQEARLKREREGAAKRSGPSL